MQDVKLSGELIDGASFTLLNLTMRTELLAALRLPLVLKSGTIGRLSIAGLDAVAGRSGKVVVTLSDVTFVFALPDPNSSSGNDTPHPTPELLVAARRTFLELMSHSAIATLSDSALGSFLATGLGAADWKEVDNLGKTKKIKKPLTSKQAAAAKAKASTAAAEAALERHKWMEYAMQSVEFVVQNLHVRVEHRNEGNSSRGRQTLVPPPRAGHDRNLPAARTVAAVGLTLPSLRIRPTEKERLIAEPLALYSQAAAPSGGQGGSTSSSTSVSGSNGSGAAKSGSESVARRLVTCSNLALYCDPAAASYLDALQPASTSVEGSVSRSTDLASTWISTTPPGAEANTVTATSATAVAPSANAANTSTAAAVSEGARRVAWLRQRWAERHDGLVFPFTASLLATFLLAPAPDTAPGDTTAGSSSNSNSREVGLPNGVPYVPTVRCDQVELQLGSIRGCLDAAQLTALADGIDTMHLISRRDRNAAFLVPMPTPASLLTDAYCSTKNGNSASSSSSSISRADGNEDDNFGSSSEERDVKAATRSTAEELQYDRAVWWREQMPPRPPPLPPTTADTSVLPLPAVVELSSHLSQDQGTVGHGAMLHAPAVAWLKRAHQNQSYLSADYYKTAVAPSSTSSSAASRQHSSTWVRAAWQWALRCVLADLRPWFKDSSSGSSWGRSLTCLRAFRRAVNLYKARHRQQLNNAALTTATATATKDSGSSSSSSAIGSSGDSNNPLSGSNHSTSSLSGAVEIDPFAVDLGPSAVPALHLFGKFSMSILLQVGVIISCIWKHQLKFVLSVLSTFFSLFLKQS